MGSTCVVKQSTRSPRLLYLFCDPTGYQLHSSLLKASFAIGYPSDHSSNDGIVSECRRRKYTLLLFTDTFISGSGPEVGTGKGPLAAVLRAGVQKLVDDSPIFTRRGDFYHLAFLPVNFGRDTLS